MVESRKLRHEVARNVADDGHTVKQLCVMLRKSEPILLLQQLHATLRTTISRVDTRCNFQVARNVVPCVWALMQTSKDCVLSQRNTSLGDLEGNNRQRSFTVDSPPPPSERIQEVEIRNCAREKILTDKSTGNGIADDLKLQTTFYSVN